ncbi:MAG: LPS export ABC transporter periplasmic protein LptC [Pseudomonadales bacterium]
MTTPPDSPRTAARLGHIGYQILLAGAVMLAVGLTALLLSPEPNSDRPRPERPPDVRLSGTRLAAFDAQGLLLYVVAAPEIRLFRSDGRADLTAPAFELFDRHQTWSGSAARGTLTGPSVGGEGEDRLNLDGDVRLTPADSLSGASLETESLIIFPARQWAETDQAVIIRGARGQTDAARLEGNLRRGSLKLFAAGDQRVATRLEPGTVH